MKRPVFLSFFLFFSLFLLLFGRVRIAPPDLAFYYSYAHSLTYDLDFCFANQYAQFPFAFHETYLTAEGYPANDWPMGTGICWIPFLVLARFVEWIALFFGAGGEAAGLTWLSKWIVTFGAAMVYSGGTIWLSYRLCRIERISHSSAIWAAALIGLGSSFTYHVYVNAADSHPPSAFFIALFLFLRHQYQEEGRVWHGFLCGCAIGMAALVRPHNLLFILIPIIEEALSSKTSCCLKKRIADWAGLFLGVGLTFSPQTLVWKLLYGSWFALPRSGDVLWTQPEIYNTLFSDYHGMISWSPLFGIGLLGLFLSKRGAVFAIPALLQLYIYSCNLAWWSGGSFGNRRMIGCTPLFIIGLAFLFDAIPKIWLKCIAVLAALWTVSLLIAEVGGTIQLNHYQTWSEIIKAIHTGFLPGVINHFTSPEWGEHCLERLFGAGAVMTVLGLIYWIGRRWKPALIPSISGLVLTVALLLNLICAVAVVRSQEALRQSDVSTYRSYDRFTWVVYYEKGFYLLKNHEPDRALDALLAAVVIEGRHPQPWKYIAGKYYEFEWNRLGYYYAFEAMINGHRAPEFIVLFDHLLTDMILTNDPFTHIYFNERGVLRAIGGNWDAAEDDFKMSVAVNPDYKLPSANLEILKEWRSGAKRPFKFE